MRMVDRKGYAHPDESIFLVKIGKGPDKAGAPTGRCCRAGIGTLAGPGPGIEPNVWVLWIPSRKRTGTKPSATEIQTEILALSSGASRT
jgi:hypothetical protein